ncbi:MAG TPA: aminoglycoside phosphotransferase family protein [Pyrinomonadaceae bacterium]|nr:aminoglycoside phosphotransferase family protein [Pyrinomonadaceae bacterium]
MPRESLELLPPKFVQVMGEFNQNSGFDWRAHLLGTLNDLEDKWQLRLGVPFENLSYHFVAPCTLYDGGQAVLKIGYHDPESPIAGEAEVLKLYDGRGAVKLLRHSAEYYALLLERLSPGRHLKTECRADARRAADVAVSLLKKVQQEPPAKHDLLSLHSWFEALNSTSGTEFPADAIHKSRLIYRHLSAAPEFLLHGDFHHENILSAEREPFLVIDPKGVVGQIGYDIAVFLNNHVWWLGTGPEARSLVAEAVKAFAKAFDLEEKELRQWAYAQSVLSAWWTFEENNVNWEQDLKYAEIWNV